MKTRAQYIHELFAHEPDGLRAIRSAMTNPDDQISVPPEDGRLLQLLVSMIGAKKIVEIGTLGGYSSTWMSRALPDDGVIYTLEHEPRRANIAEEHFKKYAARKHIEVIRGRALDNLPDLSSKGPFDLIFIDADKINYANYLDWAEANVRTGGLIIGDNTFLFNAVLDNETTDRVRETALAAMQDFNKRLANPDKYLSMMLDTGQGMTVAKKL